MKSSSLKRRHGEARVQGHCQGHMVKDFNQEAYSAAMMTCSLVHLSPVALLTITKHGVVYTMGLTLLSHDKRPGGHRRLVNRRSFAHTNTRAKPCDMTSRRHRNFLALWRSCRTTVTYVVCSWPTHCPVEHACTKNLIKPKIEIC